jgi:hypothetical protein
MNVLGNRAQPLSKCRTRGDLAAWRFLEKIIGDFSQGLGKPEKEGQSFIFKENTSSLKDVRVCYEIERKFLGKIYALVFEGRVPVPRSSERFTPIRLSYSGMVKKGRPFFKDDAKGAKNPLVQRLNGNEQLLDLCRSQDLEYLKVYRDTKKELCHIRFRPFGGSFVRLLFPPLNYGVKLPDGHARYMIESMKLISEAIGVD